MTDKEAEYFPEHSAAEPIHMGAKALFLVVQDISHVARGLIFHHDTQLKPHKEALQELQGKLSKLKEFCTQTLDKLYEVDSAITGKEREVRELLKPQEKKHEGKAKRSAARIDDRATRPTKGREKPTRKSFSLASAMAGNRVRS